jgi:hypothetical protein
MAKQLKPYQHCDRQGEVKALAAAYDLIASELRPIRGAMDRYRSDKRARLAQVAQGIADALQDALN